MKIFFFAFILFSFSSYAAEATLDKRAKETAIQQLEIGMHNDLATFNKIYLHCKSSDDMILLMKELDQKLKQPSNISLNHIACALAIDFLGEHSLALEQLKSLSSNLSNQSNYVRGEYYVALGKISYRSENPTGAIKHYKTGIKYLEECLEQEALQIAYTNLGLAYGALDKHETALVHYNKAASITEKSSPKTLLYLNLNRALSLTNIGKHTQSKEAFQNALKIIYETKDYFAETRTYGNLADIYVIEDSLGLAENYLLKGRKTATQHGFKLDLIRFDLSLAQLYKTKKEYKKAYFYLYSHDSIRNSVHIEKAAEDVVNLEKRNQAAVNDLEQKALNETILVKQQKNWILWGGITILSFFCFFLIRQFLVIRSKNTVLLKKNLAEDKIESNQRKNDRPDSLNEAAFTLIQSFEELLIEKQAFCKVDLTQEKVAKKLNTNRTYLSKAINDHYKMSYSRWLNEIRIKESKKMLIDEKFNHFSIEGIATSVGFSSLSAFNSNFKSITGLTPSYFRSNATT